MRVTVHRQQQQVIRQLVHAASRIAVEDAAALLESAQADLADPTGNASHFTRGAAYALRELRRPRLRVLS